MIYKQSLWRNDKEKLKLAIEKYKRTISDNPDILVNAGKKVSDWYKNNPDKVKDKLNKRKECYKNNPESIAKLSNTVKEWYTNNPDKVAAFRDAHQIKFLEDRLNTDFSKLLDVIHLSQANDLINGNLTSFSNILTKCPICGEYCQHSLHNVFTFNKADFRTGNPPLCNKCRVELSTSHYEQEIADYISTFYNGELIRNSRNIISPFELDLYYSEKKIAIEFNGDYWHDENHKPRNYHYDKFMACLNNRILLISIFESFWNNDKYSIKNYIYDIFNNIENKLSYINNNKNMLDNNYPVNSVMDLISNNKCKYIEHYYECKNNRVYTCGYTELIGNE